MNLGDNHLRDPYTPGEYPYPSWDFVRLALDVALPFVHDAVPDLPTDLATSGDQKAMWNILEPMHKVLDRGVAPGARLPVTTEQMTIDEAAVERVRSLYLEEVSERTGRDLRAIRSAFLRVVDGYQERGLQHLHSSASSVQFIKGQPLRTHRPRSLRARWRSTPERIVRPERQRGFAAGRGITFGWKRAWGRGARCFRDESDS